jgi:hypothetical protein
MGRDAEVRAANEERPLPHGWRVLHHGEDGDAVTGVGPDGRTLRVIWSDAIEEDGYRWRHVSVSIPRSPRAKTYQLATWTELDWVRCEFIGADREAYQVHAPAAEHVNIHPGVLHIWGCLEGPTGRVLPDFSRGSGSI